MKIALASERFINKDIEYNLYIILEALEKYSEKVDLVCFGEAFLQGFDSLSWNYEKDKKIAIEKNSSIIQRICEMAKKVNCAVSFGYIEKNNETLYCSYMFVDNNGVIIDNYRRVSIGWKEYTKTDFHYKEGEKFNSFYYKNVKFVSALCGDLWYDKNIELLNNIEKDIILWPLFVSYELDVWKEELIDYNLQAAKLKKPVLLINSISENSFGGCYYFNNGNIVKSLPMGNEGCLIIELQP